MKPFEEQYTAWIDGRLEGEELAQFERALPDRAAAEADRAHARRCGNFLRRHAAAPSLSNPDFFSHQLQERIGAEERSQRPSGTGPRRPLFAFPGLAWLGAFAALALVTAYLGWSRADRFKTVQITPAPALDATPVVYDASIIEATPREPGIYATSLHSDEENMTVLWLDGLDYLPASYQLQ